MKTSRLWRFALTVAVLMTVGLASAGAAQADKVLLLGPSVEGGANSFEAQQAAALGFQVDIVDAATWSSMTTAQFAAYRAIVIGDASDSINPSPVAAAEGNASVWGAAATGNVILAGADVDNHAPGNPGAVTFINRAIDFAAAAPGQTGAYVAWANYYREVQGTDGSVDAPAKVLDAFGPGAFLTTTADIDEIHIDPATTPAPTGLSDSTLSGWSNTAHAYLSRFPSNFKVFAVSLDPAGTITTSDGQKGFPSFLVRGPLPQCVVPKLKGKTRKKAKKKLRNRNCRLGKVKGHGKRIRKQKPKAGTILPGGSTVKVTVR